jgi:putative acetyltransferase
MDSATHSALQLRLEQPQDAAAISELHVQAFPTHAEARLVDRLRADSAYLISLVACLHERVVGHALFSNAVLARGARSVRIGALGPVAVLPAQQRSGIGAALIRNGLQQCAQLGHPAVIVLGDPNYYGRFGFSRADAWEIRCELSVPAEAFMIWWSSAPRRGPALAKYHPAFGQLEH